MFVDNLGVIFLTITICL